MPKTVDYKKLAEKLQKEVEILKGKLEASFKKGFKAVHAEIKKMEAVYEKHMQKAKGVFSKVSVKKPKKSPTKTVPTSKKPAKKVATKTKATKAKVKKQVEEKTKG